jgi:dTDP-4-dehydrorhamnose reductase
VRILLTGPTGQVGWELERALPALGEVIAVDRSTLDLADADAIRRAVREAKPDVIVNPAAYTAVDRAESEPELARQINGVAPGVLAEEAKRADALLVHYSTDYVFDGKKTAPYTEDDSPNPLSVYGRTKLEGERAVAASGCRYLTLRTSWVYASRGKNFLLTILRLARTQPELRIVDDQHGAPTWARDIALATRQLAEHPPPSGLYHLTAAGETTWYGFAREILRVAQSDTKIRPIRTVDYPLPAIRPSNSVLGNAKLYRAATVALPEWSASLSLCLADIVP